MNDRYPYHFLSEVMTFCRVNILRSPPSNIRDKLEHTLDSVRDLYDAIEEHERESNRHSE